MKKIFTKITKPLDWITDNFEKIMFYFVFLTMMFPFVWKKIINNNFDSIINLVEMFTMVTATLAILSITYAIAEKKNVDGANPILLKIGKDLFLSTILFTFGLIGLHFSINFIGTEVKALETKVLNIFVQVVKSVWFIITPLYTIIILVSFYKFCSGVIDAAYYLVDKKNKFIL